MIMIIKVVIIKHMKLKQIHDFLKHIVISLIVKRDGAIEDKLPKTIIEYAEGQLYEAQYILDIFEKVLYEDEKLVTDNN